MTIDIITLFPDMFRGPFDESMIKRAQEKNIATIRIHNLRDWGIDERGTVDDHPYGGGPGMLLRPEPIYDAVESVVSAYKKTTTYSKGDHPKRKTILFDAGGTLYSQQKAFEYCKLDQLVLICGHYEGVDYRVHEHLADDVVSIGNFVLTGGELPAMLVTDSVVRLLPGVLNKMGATYTESFSSSSKTVEYPQFTRPEIYKDWEVPPVLLSGHHAEIEKWRQQEAVKRTRKNRPDL